MVHEETPFLYNLIKSKILHQSNDDADNDVDDTGDSSDEGDNIDGNDSLCDPKDDAIVPDEEARVAAKIFRAHMVISSSMYLVEWCFNDEVIFAFTGIHDGLLYGYVCIKPTQKCNAAGKLSHLPSMRSL
jgi:hypothetical protein